MTTEAQVPNPYNAKTVDEPVKRGFVSADDALFNRAPDEPKVTEVEGDEVTDEVKATSEEDLATTEDPAEKYTKVDYKKRHDDLKRYYDSKLQEWRAREAELRSKLEEGIPSYKVPKTQEELEAFREEAPDVYDVIETVAHMQAEAKVKALQEKVAELSESEMRAKHEAAREQLLRMHSDFEELAATSDFSDWASEQPEEIQRWVYENATNAFLAARAMDLYKKDRGIGVEKKKEAPKKTKKPAASAADMVSVKTKAEPVDNGKKVWTTSEIEGLSIRDFESNADQIDEAWREGRVVKG